MSERPEPKWSPYFRLNWPIVTAVLLPWAVVLAVLWWVL